MHEIRRSVASSVRSHYERKELEALFEIQPRAAQLILEMLPSTTVGRSRLVEREALAGFLDRIHRAEDPSRELERIRANGREVSHKKLRTLVRRDVQPLQIGSLPLNIEFVPGQMTVRFRTIEDLAQAMYSLARVIEADGDELARRYEIHEAAEERSPIRSEYEALLEELSTQEGNRSATITPPQHPKAS